MAHTTGLYNIEGTLAAWLQTGLVTNKPGSVSAVTLEIESPEKGTAFPAWSLHFLAHDPDPRAYLGNQVEDGKSGRKMYGMIEVGCWVSRNADEWREQMHQMVDAVVETFQETKGGIIIKDFTTTPNTPTNTAYRITLDRFEVRTPPVDPNPDIERRRVIIHYQWVERT
jgi:hypothetical protein